MPIYEFDCPIHGRFEQIFSLSAFNEIRDGIMCSRLLVLEGKNREQLYCGEVAEKVWSLPAYPSHGIPTVIYKNPRTGEIRTAILRNQETPAGYEKIELKTPFERTKAEKEMQENANAENGYVTERNRYLKEETQKNRHNDLKARMGTITKDSENPSAAADLLKVGMARSRKKKLPPKKTEFHFAINHNNQSNLDKG